LGRFKSLQLGPWLIGEEKPRCAGQILVTAVAGGEGELAGWIRELGRSFLGVMGRSLERSSRLRAILNEMGQAVAVDWMAESSAWGLAFAAAIVVLVAD
jgi:hypothetical protein